jgi:hypothetical protein
MALPTILYFVAARSRNNDSQDLLVVATDAAHAEILWREHFDLELEDKPEYVSPVPGVTPTRDAGAIGWEEISPN